MSTPTVPTLRDVAGRYGRTALEAVQREYPNAPRHVTSGPDDRPTPREAHPAFYGCFDWHSAVEMHWALVRLLRHAPDELPPGTREVLDAHLSTQALDSEAAYLRAHPTFERPYGWGWLLQLASELDDWALEGDPDAARWAAALEPVASAVSDGLVAWLPRLTYPERVGTHQNSAFALCRALPFARAAAAAGRADLWSAISDAAVRWYGNDVEYPASWEPGGSDFLSPALTEAVLIASIASPESSFRDWLGLFLPGLADGHPASLLTPAVVTDPSDGQGAHLHGLNLYRAHAFGVLAEHLELEDPRRTVLREARTDHAAASLPAVSGGGWMLEHWLAAYAVLLLG
ncbi:DUF2891 domain-containing protein [Jatrophihabitans endophyticus]|uniref:DUF2891 domain-containing protein n=1 Tax=Jatrophihabitans endophyticus TaxID=1206085 RepID=UPI0019D9FCF4|nr:DUF2891 domain-containing protein [Jatrophihabitans endophyticus]MBE7187249.1 DUF2891 domain-containing protein [Jatrophihabitans endophyticus]